MLKSVPKRTVLAFLCCGALANQASAAQILGYQFNETGTTAAAVGTASSAGTPVLNLQASPSGAATNLHSADGGGVSGLPGDRSFNNTAATAMGGAANSSGGRGLHGADFAAIDNLTSFTISGWFKTDTSTMVGGNAIIVSNRNGVNGFELRGDINANGALLLAVDNGSVSSTTAFGATQQWVSFAVTYDGTAVQPGPNVFFYVGGIAQPFTAAGSGTNITGAADEDTAVLSIGATKFAFNNNNLNPFDGFLDNLRIYDNVLSQSQLEAVRLTDVPEPATLSVLGLLGAMLAIRRHRHD